MWQKNEFTADSCLGTLGGRSICSETDKNNRQSLFLVECLADGASPLLFHSHPRKIPVSARPGHMLSRLLPGYCCHSFPLKGHNVEPPLCEMTQSSEDGEENWDRKCYFSPYCQGQGLLDLKCKEVKTASHKGPFRGGRGFGSISDPLPHLSPK